MTRAEPGSAPRFEDVLERVRQTIVELEALDAATVRSESRLGEDLGMDSLAQIELAMALEEAYDVTLDEAAASAISTVREAAEAVCAALPR